MPDYSKGKIYKISSPNCVKIYIGSTTKSLNKRLIGHKTDAKTKKCRSKIVIDCGNAIIELIELFPCESKTELERREGEIQKATLNLCNKLIAGRTDQEYYIDNKDKLAEYHIEYIIKNKDKIDGYHKAYKIKNKDKINEGRRKLRLKNKLLRIQMTPDNPHPHEDSKEDV